MNKSFENFEIWFVTGAQLLYGGDAVVHIQRRLWQVSITLAICPLR